MTALVRSRDGQAMELCLESLFDGPPEGHVGGGLDPGSQPLSFRSFSRDMLQVLPRQWAVHHVQLSASQGPVGAPPCYALHRCGFAVV